MDKLQEILTDVEYLPLLLHFMAGGSKAETAGNPPLSWWGQSIDFTNYEKILDTVTDITLGNSLSSSGEEPKKTKKQKKESPSK